MDDGQALKAYISGNNVDISHLANKLNISRAVIYTHFKKPSLKSGVKEMYTSHFGEDLFIDNSLTPHENRVFSGENNPIVKNDTNITNNNNQQARPTTNSYKNEVMGFSDHRDEPDFYKALKPTANTKNKGVPYYDIDFMGGFDLVFNSQQVQPSFYIDFLPFNDCDCWINVTGKSMGPLIAHGDIVGLKQVLDWQRFLLEGEIYAVITDNGFRTIKMLGAGPDKEHYTLIPYNKSEDYKPQVIPKDVITHIFRVKGNIKKFF